LVILTGVGIFTSEKFGTSVMHAIYYKFVYRQLDTGACLANVIASQTGSYSLVDSVRLFLGIVPGALWPSKPNLSVGMSYGWQYCSIPQDVVGTHSASVTLLGDPLILAGWSGLAIAEIAIVLGLAALTRAAFVNRNGSTVMLALMPWLADFDQHYPLYVAQAVKCFLYMLPFLMFPNVLKHLKAIRK
jgi:hypothetical protein